MSYYSWVRVLKICASYWYCVFKVAFIIIQVWLSMSTVQFLLILSPSTTALGPPCGRILSLRIPHGRPCGTCWVSHQQYLSPFGCEWLWMANSGWLLRNCNFEQVRVCVFYYRDVVVRKGADVHASKPVLGVAVRHCQLSQTTTKWSYWVITEFGRCTILN